MVSPAPPIPHQPPPRPARQPQSPPTTAAASVPLGYCLGLWGIQNKFFFPGVFLIFPYISNRCLLKWGGVLFPLSLFLDLLLLNT